MRKKQRTRNRRNRRTEGDTERTGKSKRRTEKHTEKIDDLKREIEKDRQKKETNETE